MCQRQQQWFLDFIIIIEQVAWNKSSLFLKVQIQNTQTLQLFTEIFEMESMYMCYLNAKPIELGFKDQVVKLKWASKHKHFKERSLIWVENVL